MLIAGVLNAQDGGIENDTNKPEAEKKLPAGKRYFYTGKDYGSEYKYNPLNLILNAGYDIYQARQDHQFLKAPYRRSLNDFFGDVFIHPFESIREYGTYNFFHDEVFPMSADPKHTQWFPNYTLHLFGGALEMAILEEYYSFYEIPLPRLWAGVTLMTYHFVNEVVENDSGRRYNVDPISDIWIFDIGGLVLGSFDGVKKFYSKTLNAADWSLQPTFGLPDKTLENTGHYFSIKWKFPFEANERWHLFLYYGLNFIGGLSFKTGGGYCISGGGGARTKKVFVVDEAQGRQTITYVYSAGLFLDRNNSLLASLIFNTNFYHTMQLNVYPGFLKIGYFTPGFWINVSPRGDVMTGITFQYMPGIGYVMPHYYSEKI